MRMGRVPAEEYDVPKSTVTQFAGNNSTMDHSSPTVPGGIEARPTHTLLQLDLQAGICYNKHAGDQSIGPELRRLRVMLAVAWILKTETAIEPRRSYSIGPSGQLCLSGWR
jgi:hypothetical protein